MSDENKSLVRL